MESIFLFDESVIPSFKIMILIVGLCYLETLTNNRRNLQLSAVVAKGFVEKSGFISIVLKLTLIRFMSYLPFFNSFQT
jgi:hypothetical protein